MKLEINVVSHSATKVKTDGYKNRLHGDQCATFSNASNVASCRGRKPRCKIIKIWWLATVNQINGLRRDHKWLGAFFRSDLLDELWIELIQNIASTNMTTCKTDSRYKCKPFGRRALGSAVTQFRSILWYNHANCWTATLIWQSILYWLSGCALWWLVEEWWSPEEHGEISECHDESRKNGKKC